MALFGKKKQEEQGKTDRPWGMDEYRAFFQKEGGKEGNSKEFQAVVDALSAYEKARTAPVTKENVKALAEAQAQLTRTCETYAEARKGAKSSSGKARLEAVRQLADYHVAVNAKEDERRVLEAVEPELAKGNTAYQAEKGKAITQESAIRIVAASDKVKKAGDICDAYKSAGILSEEGKRRMDAMAPAVAEHRNLNLDEARDLRVVREHAGKTWEQVGAFKTAEYTLSGKAEKVGANVSQRLKVEHNGQKGFFTARMEFNSLGRFAEQLIEQVDPVREPEIKRIMEANRNTVKKALESVSRSPKNEVFDAKLGHDLADAWDKMPTQGKNGKESKKKAEEKLEFGNVVIGHNLNKTKQVMKDYFDGLEKNPGLDRAGKEALLKEAVSKQGDKKYQKLLMANRDLLLSIPKPEAEMRDSVVRQYQIRGSLLEAKAAIQGTKEEAVQKRQDLDRLIGDGRRLNEWVGVAVQSFGVENAQEAAGLELDKGSELTNRNVATSRMAELLGVGNLVAHSRKMTIRDGEKTMTGCFMEFAEGIDPKAMDYKSEKMLSEIGYLETPGSNRDFCNIDLFDYICGQGDRHGNNMFYKLSEPDKDGKRSVVGIQGIDNDLSFRDSGDLNSVKSTILDKMIFVDKGMAERLRGLDRQTVEYAVGDLISEKQVDFLMERIEKAQKHLEANMVEIEGKDWDLKEFDEKQYGEDLSKSGLDKRGQNYVNGLRGLEKTRRAKYPWDLPNKSYFAKKAIIAAKERIEKEGKEEEELLGGMESLFKEEEKPARQKVSFNELSRAEAPARRASVLAGKRAERQAQRQARQPEKAPAEKERAMGR